MTRIREVAVYVDGEYVSLDLETENVVASSPEALNLIKTFRPCERGARVLRYQIGNRGEFTVTVSPESGLWYWDEAHDILGMCSAGTLGIFVGVTPVVEQLHSEQQ